MKIGPLKLFMWGRQDGKKTSRLIIAAWHWKWSITWSFILDYDHCNRLGKRFGFWRVHRQQGFYFHTGLRLPFCGLLMLQTQPSMKDRGYRK